VEHDVCAMPGCPADRFRIAPTFMADRDTKRQRTGLEDPPSGTGRIGRPRRGRVDFVWKPATVPSGLMTNAVANRAPSTTRSVPRTTARLLPLRRSNGGPGAFEERRVGCAPISLILYSRNEAFRKADEAGALDGRLSNGLFGQCDRLLESPGTGCWRGRFETCSFVIAI